jgi:hypothetical protein
MDEACVTHAKREEGIQALEGKLKERNISENLGVDGTMTLKLILKKGMVLFHLSQNRYKCWGVVSMETKFRVP